MSDATKPRHKRQRPLASRRRDLGHRRAPNPTRLRPDPRGASDVTSHMVTCRRHATRGAEQSPRPTEAERGAYLKQLVSKALPEKLAIPRNDLDLRAIMESLVVGPPPSIFPRADRHDG